MEDNMWTILDVLIVIMLFGYGFKYYTDPPRMRDGKGFRMKFLTTDEETFRYGNRMGGLLCIILGVIVGIFAAISYFWLSDTSFTLVTGVIEFGLVIAMYFVLKLLVAKKFGETKKSKNPYDKKRKKK